MGLLSKAGKIAKVAKKVTDTKKSAVRKVFDELPEDVKSEMPSQPDDLSVYGYHGTAKERSADKPFFDINFARKQDQFMGEGFYFTMDPVIAGEYANTRAIDLAPAKESIRGQEALNIMNDPKVDRNLLGSAFTTKTSAANIDISSDGSLTTFDSLKQGKDIYGNPIGEGQSIARFDLSGLEKPYVVKNNKERLYLKDNIEKIKKQGYDSVLFAEFGDRSKQIMVFPEHMDKIDTTEMASAKRASSNFAEPLEIGINKDLEDGKFLKEYNAETVSLLDSLVKDATAGSSTKNKLINKRIEDGTKVGIRLNLSSKIDGAPKGVDKLQTLHKNNFNGKALSYVPYATVENVIFNVSQKGRAGIASKKYAPDVPEAQNKFPAMSVDGNYKPNRNILNELDDTVVEIGFNPMNLHLFVDMKTGQAVKGADVATVIGDRVYAKNVTYLKKADAPDPIKASDKTELPSEVRYKFADGGLLPSSLTPKRSTMAMNPILKHHYENIATGNAVENEDGSLSTVKTAIVEIDGKETLIPTVWNGEILEGDRLKEAIDNAVNSGIKWPSIDAENVKAIDRLNNLDKLLHQDMEPISKEEAQKVLVKEFSKRRNIDNGIQRLYDTTRTEDEINFNTFKDKPVVQEKNVGKGLYDRLRNTPIIKNIKNVDLTGENKSIQFGFDFNKGGTPMMEKQMEMVEDGGLKDQGGTVDPMSGNDVPVGSTQKEVRDDIPAQLSEGEFVFPADVVRYIGLEKLMNLRQQAKMGLKRMEQMGQMGNSDEATMPDDMPFGMADLIVVSPEGKEVEMAEGGVVQAATGVNVTPSTRGSTTGVTRNNNVTPASSNFSTTTTRPLVTGTSNTGTRPNVPTFENVMGQASITLIQYQNAEGATLMVPHMGGKPIYPVPAGYFEVNSDGTPVNPEDVPAVGTGDTTTTQPVKPIEVSDGPDKDIIGMVPGSVGSAASSISATSSMADLMTGKREPTMLEKMYIGSKAQIAVTEAQLKAAGIRSTGNAERDLLAISLYNSTMEGKRSGIVPNSEEDIKNKKDIEDLKTKYVGKNTKLANQQMTKKQTFTPPAEEQITKVTPTAQQIANQQMSTDQSFTPTAQQIANQQIANQQMTTNQMYTPDATPTAQQIANQQMTTNQMYTPDVTQTSSIDTQKMLDAYKDYNPYSTVPKVTNFSDPDVQTPPKVEEVVNVLTEKGIKNVYTPSKDYANVDFGEYNPPQASLDQYNLANPTYADTTSDKSFIEQLFDKDLQAAKRENTQKEIASFRPSANMVAQEEIRARDAEEFAQTEAKRAEEEQIAAQQQLAQLMAEEERSKPDAPEVSIGGPAGIGGVSVGEAGRGGGPDRGGDAGGGGFGGGGGNSYGGGPMNKGGLAAKKPKKKLTKKYKKGGLAASKK